jgi:transposase
MGAPKKADWREERSKHAWELKQAGRTQKEIAEVLGVTEGAVSQWMKSASEGGSKRFLCLLPPLCLCHRRILNLHAFG